jgi:glycosyltransferase involved in cell wall biosynthesis
VNIAIDGRPLADRFPGIGRYLANLLPALLAADPALRLTVFADPAARGGRFDPFAFAGERCSVVPLDAPVFSLRGQLSAARAIDRGGFDLLHAPYFLTPIGLRTPFVLTIHDLIALHHPEVLPGRLARLVTPFLLTAAARSARRVIAVSRWVADDVVARGVADRVVVVYHAADQLLGREGGGRNPAWPTPPYLLFVGADKPLKNVPFLVRAYAASGVTVPLVLAGPLDPRHRATADTIAALGLDDRVRQIGPVPEEQLPALYRGALALLFPSRAEGFGLPPLEAMQLGVPVVCSTAMSLPEVVGEAAVLLPPNDEAGWANAIKRITEDGSLRATLAEAGRWRAKQFSWADAARQTLAVYREAIGAPLASGVAS